MKERSFATQKEQFSGSTATDQYNTALDTCGCLYAELKVAVVVINFWLLSLSLSAYFVVMHACGLVATMSTVV